MMTPEQELRLISAMAAANAPLNLELKAVKDYLRELNGKVATHAVLHEGSRVLLATYAERLADLERRGESPGRREGDQSGENRTLKKWDAGLVAAGFCAGVGGLLWLLNVIGKI